MRTREELEADGLQRASHPEGDDRFNDAGNYPYTFAEGYADAAQGIAERSEPHWTIAEGAAYRLGRYEWEAAN